MIASIAVCLALFVPVFFAVRSPQALTLAISIESTISSCMFFRNE